MLYTYIHKNPVCVYVYVRKTPESRSLVVLSTRQYRLLLNKNGLSMSLQGNWTLGYAHTAQGYCVNMFTAFINEDM